ncbi:MAG: hypothetical protein K0R50_3855 [Eubacterium sp.]|nr:hypothetical protein [Eubacterium sp.]
MNKDNVLLNPDVIEECLCESFDIFEKYSSHNQDNTSNVNEIAS